MEQKLSTLFANNRAEENPDDLWGSFVLPLNYSNYNLLNYNKSSIVVGARGSGKTSFLKYHCYKTQFSKRKGVINKTDFNKVGIYWKPDTNFSQLINKEYLGEAWKNAFISYSVLSLLKELSDFVLFLINENPLECDGLITNLKTLEIPEILSEQLNTTRLKYTELSEKCKSILIFKFSQWINFPEDSLPFSFANKDIVELVILDLIGKISVFTGSVFHVFIDEFENLTEDQQIIINTWLKHSSKNLIFNAAYKKHAKITSKTLGEEKLNSHHDYRLIDLIEDVYFDNNKQDFNVLAAEIICLKLRKFNLLEGKIADIPDVSSIIDITTRKTKDYQDKIIEIVKEFLPDQGYDEIARQIINDSKLYSRVIESIDKALTIKKSKIPAINFVNEAFPSESLVNSVLLFRKNMVPEVLLSEFNGLLSAKKSSIYKSHISNNLVGTILLIYHSYSMRVCPIYAGFNTFTTMARNNLRHFFELCYQAIIVEEENNPALIQNTFPIISIDSQLRAVQRVSNNTFERIAELGEHGQILKQLASRLGEIFELRQLIKSQGEPEVNHFSLKGRGIEDINTSIKRLMEEALHWNVLIRYDSTKDKDIGIPNQYEWMLNSMLAPHFRISYRKKRKIDLDEDQIVTIFTGTREDFKNLYKELKKKWGIDSDEEEKLVPLSLFGNEL